MLTVADEWLGERHPASRSLPAALGTLLVTSLVSMTTSLELDRPGGMPKIISTGCQ